jgi:uncharacterized membrane protein YkoI
MMQSIRHIFLGATATILVFSAGTAMADERHKMSDKQAAYEAVLPVISESDWKVEKFAQRKDNRQISASQAKSAALRSRPGAKFVNIQMSGNGTYRVRLQEKNGRIVDVYVDARTGRVKN